LPEVRRAEPADFPDAARLLHLSAVDMYDRFAGGRERALLLLERSLARPGNASSAEVVWLAELDGRVAAGLAGFPVAEAVERSAAFMRLALRNAPPWHWLPALRLYWVGGRAAPTPPPDAFYVDSLATDPGFRRRGAATALLAEAERQALARGLGSVALDTTEGNAEARALYGREGFEEVAYRPAARGLPGFVALVKPLS
jgi:ribosomal protein S18 acetylase RimI-like enzyme